MHNIEEIKSNQQRILEQRRRQWYQDVTTSANKYLRLFGPICGQLPHDIGFYRISLPFFELKDGVSLLFLDYHDDTIRNLPDGQYAAEASSQILLSWRGFACRPDPGRHGMRSERLRTQEGAALICEIDLTSEGRISIDREALVSDVWTSLTNFLRVRGSELFTSFAKEHLNSPYVALSADWSRLGSPSTLWFFPSEEEGGLDWRETRFPAVLTPRIPDEYNPRYSSRTLALNGLCDDLRPVNVEKYGTKKLWPLNFIRPTRIMVSEYYQPPLVVYDNCNDIAEDLQITVPFPPEWDKVVAIDLEGRLIYNYNNVIVQLSSVELRLQLAALEGNTVEIISRILECNTSVAATWFLSQMGAATEFWNALRDNFRDEFTKILALVGLNGDDYCVVWQAQYPYRARRISQLGAVSEEGWIGRFREAGADLVMPADQRFLFRGRAP